MNDKLWPAPIVFGSERPLIPKPVPEIVARFRTKLAFPLFVNVTLCVPVCPTVTLLKFNDAGEIVSPGCMPVPLREIVSGEFEASLVTVRSPVAAPSDGGANRTWTVTLCPTGIEEEGFPPITLNADPETVACEMFTAAVPVFVTLTLCVALLPTATFPKLRLLELAESIPAPGVPGCPPPPAWVT